MLEGERILFYDEITDHRPGMSEFSKCRTVWEETKVIGNMKFTHFEIDHFADCVINGKKPISDGETTLKSLQLIWKLYDAERSGIVPDLRDCAIDQEDLENYTSYIESLDS